MCSTLMYNIVNNKVKGYSCKQKLLSIDHCHNTRQKTSQLLYIETSSTNQGKRSFVNNGATIWNSIDKNIRESLSIHSFKKHMKKSLISGTFQIDLYYD